MYPRVNIDVKKYEDNVRYMHTLCHDYGMTMMAVTKVFCAAQPLIDVLNRLRVDFIADSRLENLATMKTDCKKVLLRLPSIHEVDRVVTHANLSLNSELKTVEALNKAAKRAGKKHGVILMIDIGDLREGIYYKENVLNAIRDVKALAYIDLVGIGTNLTCFGGIVPTEDTLKKLIDIIDMAKRILKTEFRIVSGGNSSHIHLMLKGKEIPEVNNLRLGEALVLGRETAYGKAIPNMHQDVITLEADLIEIKHKPSFPEGEIGMNAFGQKPMFEDYGLMKRGILAIGKQDVDYHEIIPCDNRIRLVGSSSDHIIVDLTNTGNDYDVGDVLRFKLSYGSLLSVMTSQYVVKHYG